MTHPAQPVLAPVLGDERDGRGQAVGASQPDIAGLRTAREKAYPSVAVDRTSKAAFGRVYRRATGLVAAFLQVLARPVPYRTHTVLTDDGIQFGEVSGRRMYDRGHHPFGRACRALGNAPV